MTTCFASACGVELGGRRGAEGTRAREQGHQIHAVPVVRRFLVWVAIRRDCLLQCLAYDRCGLVAGVEEESAYRRGHYTARFGKFGRLSIKRRASELQEVHRRGGLARFDQRLRVQPPVCASFGSRRLTASASPPISSNRAGCGVASTRLLCFAQLLVAADSAQGRAQPLARPA